MILGELGSLTTALYYRNHITNKEYCQKDSLKLPTWNVESSSPFSNIAFHVPPFSTKIPTADDETDYKYQSSDSHYWPTWVQPQQVFPDYPQNPHQSKF